MEVLGSSTHYWVYGPRDARVTLVAVHGFRGEHHGLEPVVAHLHDVRVIAPDLPGFGDSPALGGREHSTATYAEWLGAFLRALGLGDDVVILGHSFGSIVTSAALASGVKASKLILVNPIAAPALKGPRGIATRLAIFYFWLGAVLPERVGLGLLRNGVIVRLSTGSMIKSKSASLRRWINDQHDVYFSRFATRQVVLESFKASVSSDVSTYASRIHTPTLLIAADRDDITALPAQYELQKLFPNARLAVIEGVGHLIHYEKPAEAAAAIEGFLA
ncbi:hypothetical protein GCM10025780_31590 [Frondihabitans cladoniiphilus]|uniref:AB hydrolase-1 domain-containing protein n=1 Tax=Frondihabitans cladoniiphilus TaxID=715785 RepID=A0ABP8W7Z9_9MICO